MKKIVFLLFISNILFCTIISGAAAIDLRKGKRVFNKCKACHTLIANKNRVGPSLKSLFGRKAGTVPDYRYSKAMIAAGKKGLIWSENSLAKYLKKPSKYIKGTKMVFVGIKKPKDIDNLIGFLKKATQ